MSIGIFKDFVLGTQVSSEVIEKYKDHIPAELLEVWKNYGFGTFLGGYLKVINPDEYLDILNDSYYAANVSIPIFTTGFGDIIVWKDSKYVSLVKYRKKQIETLSSGFKFFFSDLEEDPEFVKQLDNGLYSDAVSVHGALEYDECYGFIPLLVIGGNESVDNLQKVKIIPHIDLITQTVGRIE